MFIITIILKLTTKMTNHEFLEYSGKLKRNGLKDQTKFIMLYSKKNTFNHQKTLPRAFNKLFRFNEIVYLSILMNFPLKNLVYFSYNNVTVQHCLAFTDLHSYVSNAKRLKQTLDKVCFVCLIFHEHSQLFYDFWREE